MSFILGYLSTNAKKKNVKLAIDYDIGKDFDKIKFDYDRVKEN